MFQVFSTATSTLFHTVFLFSLPFHFFLLFRARISLRNISCNLYSSNTRKFLVIHRLVVGTGIIISAIIPIHGAFLSLIQFQFSLAWFSFLLSLSLFLSLSLSPIIFLLPSSSLCSSTVCRTARPTITRISLLMKSNRLRPSTSR